MTSKEMMQKSNLSTNNLDRYDRQNRTYGSEATKTLTNSTVVIVGLSGGLATESCKNLILSGVLNIIMIEDGYITSSDIATGFYFKEEDIGLARHLALSEKLADLNPYCKITSTTLDKVEINNMTVLVHNISPNDAIMINNKCRENNSKFIWACSKGVSGFVFADVSDNHIVTDMTGEMIDPVQVASIDNLGTVTCAQHNVHDFQTGDTIVFTNVSGDNISFLEKEWTIVSDNKSKFRLNDFGDHDFNFINGTVNHIKKPVVIKHNKLSEQLTNPTINGFNPDFDKKVIDVLNDTVPSDCWSDEMNTFLSKFDDTKLRKIIRSHPLELMPVVSVIGSFAAMEVIKSITNKFTPINQWLVYSDPEIVPDVMPEDLSKSGLGLLFGSNIESELAKSNWLMVGCGAIGCEMLKNLAKLNITTDGGTIFITDPDHIEKSNLSRQFLFRNNHIGKSKSRTAIESIGMMNPSMNMIALEEKMCSDNQHLLDKMLPELTGVVNALDNIEARRYMDEQCFRYGLPLFESGTQGMKGNTQPVIPFITETYSNSSDPAQEKSFPVCTIKNFPNQPLHTIHWSMDYFDIFRRGPENVLKYINDGTTFIDSLSGYDASVAKEDIYKYCVKYNPSSWQGCATWAADMYLDLYRDQIMQLLHSFPEDSVTSDGELFWSKGKRCPQVLKLDLSNELTVDFVEATTHLFTRTCGLEDNFGRDELIVFLQSYNIYEFSVDESKKMASNDKELKNQDTSSDEDYVIPSVDEIKVHFTKMISQQFEKDDDSNWHISFVTAASNLRSTNYGIPVVTFDEAKGIAGKIVPAVATTTSIVAGLISMEFLKFMSIKASPDNYTNKNTVELYKSWFVSLANNIMVASEPMTAPMLKFGEVEINSWTKFEENEDMTLNMFIAKYEKKFNTTLGMVLYGTSIMFANFMPCEYGDKLLSDIFTEKYDRNIFSSNLEILISSDDDTLELPTIQLKAKSQTVVSA
jgi:ubiquitin-activating enzyme E1